MEGVSKAFVINLRRRADRLEGFLARCPFSSIDVIEAVDGFDSALYSLHAGDPSTRQLYERYKALHAEKPSTPRLRCGEFGCMASHVRIYTQMIEQGISSAAIFEDDAFFTANFSKDVWPRLLRSMAATAPAGPTGMLYLGGRFDDASRLPSYRDSGLGGALVFHDFDKGTWDWWQEDRTTHAYVLTRSMAERLLHFFLYEDGTAGPIDHSLFRFFKRSNTPPLNAQPLVCYCPKGHETDIQGRQELVPL
jgi:GR25 family glycosyltransferase involved in LPS biosynthesis